MSSGTLTLPQSAKPQLLPMTQSNLNPIGSPEPQTYKFEFISDREKFTTAFKGILSEADIHSLLKTLQTHLFSESPEIIRKYLSEHPTGYLDFHSEKSTMSHHDVMAHAKGLLCCTTARWIDAVTGATDNYFSVADHQEWIQKNVCEGCCFAVKKTALEYGRISIYNIIGQTFKENRADTDAHGYFDIRTNDGSAEFRSLQQIHKPVIPPFGCVDMIALLMDIGDIKTGEQALHLAVR